MITNFHTHTQRCKHAWGSDEEYVQSAVNNGYKILGFADHTCWPFPRYVSGIRMSPAEFPDYVKSVRNLKEKYKDQIEIRLGMEAEYEEKYLDWMLDLCIEYDVDYLILGHHFVGGEEKGCYSGAIRKKDLQAYVDSARKALETGMYSYLAHPELFMRSSRIRLDEDVEQIFREIAQMAKELDIPLEYNCAGLVVNLSCGVEYYPHHRFWEIAAETGCKAIIGMDAHCPEYLDISYYNKARTYLESLNMEIVEEIPKTDFQAIKQKRQAQGLYKPFGSLPIPKQTAQTTEN